MPRSTPPRAAGIVHWIAVASAEHVRIGRAQGFMQVGHGKGAPLRRIKPGDRVVYYSPSETMGGKDKLQSFTAIGTVRRGDVYQGSMGNGFRPFRRDVDWLKAREAPIRPLLDRLEFTSKGTNWGYQLRFGLFTVSTEDFQMIAAAMGADLSTLSDVMPGLDPGIHAERGDKKKRGWPDQVRP